MDCASEHLSKFTCSGVLVDEAAQATEPETLLPLVHCSWYL